MLVGREQELSVLNTSVRAMMEGKGSILFLTGEAGLGKTTLVHEWWKTVAPDTAIYAEAACSIPIGNMDVGKLEALQPWADIVAQLQATGNEEKKKLDLKKLIFDSAPAWAWALPIVGGIAHGAMETARLVKEQQSDSNPNAQNQQQVFQQYVNLLTKIADETPLVILLDDMHWADTSSTNLLFYLSRQITSKHILVLVTYRPDDALIGTDGKRHPVIQIKNEIIRYDAGKELILQYLDRGAIRSVMQNMYPGYETDDRFENWLRKISDGNSLFVTQFIKTLQEDGHLGENGAFIGTYGEIKIPDSALAVVEERTARLDDATRELLSYATAEGEEFTSYVLGQLTSKKPLELLRDLRKAEAVGLVQSKKSTRQFANQTTSVFGFSHALFHKALYDGLLSEERDILHRQCYEILRSEWDRLSGTQEWTSSLASKLLTHAEKCGEHETAATVALKAARGAWQTYAEAEALEMLGHVITLADAGLLHSESTMIDALLLQARIHGMYGRSEKSLAAAMNAQDRSQALHDDLRTAAAMNRIGLVYFSRGEFEKAQEFYERSMEIRESIGDREGIAVSLNNIGNIHASIGEYDKVLVYHIRSLEIRESIGDREGIGASLNNIGVVHEKLGAYDEALEHYVRSLEIDETIGNRAGIALVLGNIGNVYKYRYEYDKALEYHARSLEIRETIGDRTGIAMSLGNIGNVHSSLGAYGKALEYYARSLEIQEAIGDRSSIAVSLNNIGSVQRKQAKLAEGRKSLEGSLAIAAELKSMEILACGYCELGLLSEAEASQCEGEEKTKKIRDAVAQLEKGLGMLHEMNRDDDEIKDLKKDFERIKRIANSV